MADDVCLYSSEANGWPVDIASLFSHDIELLKWIDAALARMSIGVKACAVRTGEVVRVRRVTDNKSGALGRDGAPSPTRALEHRDCLSGTLTLRQSPSVSHSRQSPTSAASRRIPNSEATISVTPRRCSLPSHARVRNVLHWVVGLAITLSVSASPGW